MVDSSAPSIKRGPSAYWSSRYEAVPVSLDGTREGSQGSSLDVLRYERGEPASGDASLVGVRAAGDGQGAGGALAPLTKSVDTFSESVDEKTGEYLRVTRDTRCAELRIIRDQNEASAEARSERFALQRISRDILSWHDRKRPINSGKRALKTASGEGVGTSPWRVTWCNWRAFEDPSVWIGKDTCKAHYKGLAVCGSVWTCPVCAAKISNLRAQEIQRACDAHHEAGGSLIMATFTFSHSRNDDLGALIGDSKRAKGLRAALRRFRQSRTWREFKEDTGIIGMVRNLEVTYGDANGWHPHVHELWFLPYHLSDRARARIKAKLFAAWKKACVESGLSAPNQKRGIDLLGVVSPAEYLAKMGREQLWGVDAEMTKSHIKRGRFQSMSPFDLLRCVASGGARAAEARTRFAEYAHAFHGSRQCFWSAGLKAHFGVDEVSDEEAAKLEAEKSYRVAIISKSCWKALLRLRYEARGLVLRLAETGGEQAVLRFIAPG